MVERISYRVEEHYSMDAEHPRLGARYRVDEMDKELFLFVYLPDEYNEDHVMLRLAEIDRLADTAARLAVQAVAAEREACVARLEGLVEKFKSYEYTVERVSYIADLLEAEVAAIRAGTGEGEQG